MLNKKLKAATLAASIAVGISGNALADVKDANTGIGKNVTISTKIDRSSQFVRPADVSDNSSVVLSRIIQGCTNSRLAKTYANAQIVVEGTPLSDADVEKLERALSQTYDQFLLTAYELQQIEDLDPRGPDYVNFDETYALHDYEKILAASFSRSVASLLKDRKIVSSGAGYHSEGNYGPKCAEPNEP